MTISNSTESLRSSKTQSRLAIARRLIGGRRGLLLVLASVAIVGGLAFNWSWLVAAGIAPVIVGLLPCVAMCALGLCLPKLTGSSVAPEPPSSDEEGRTGRVEG